MGRSDRQTANRRNATLGSQLNHYGPRSFVHQPGLRSPAFAAHLRSADAAWRTASAEYDGGDGEHLRQCFADMVGLFDGCGDRSVADFRALVELFRSTSAEYSPYFDDAGPVPLSDCPDMVLLSMGRPQRQHGGMSSGTDRYILAFAAKAV